MKACIRCISQFGFKLEDRDKTFETDSEHADHMENVHGMVVIREGETKEQAQKRCAAKGIVPDRNVCQCEECKILRGEPFSIRVTDMNIARKYLEDKNENF